MLYLHIEFPGRRYHATPWGHHVNEGLVEWPPSPWRILRALLATGYAKLGWKEVPDEMRQLVEALAESAPTYRLPPATRSHTRHYMPIKGWTQGIQATSLVIDAFARPEGAIGIEWPGEISAVQRDMLASLLDHLGYLGRAESRVRASMVEGPTDLPPGAPVSTKQQDEDDEPVRLLAPVSSSDYVEWCKRTPGSPTDLLAALQVNTTELQKNGWSAPPGSRELVYWRTARAFSPAWGRGSSILAGVSGANTALFALATDRKRDVLPLMERALPTMEIFRRALLSKVGDEQLLGQCLELTGKDQCGQPLRNRGHDHAHFVPLSLDERNRGRIDHVMVYASMGFSQTSQHALRRISKMWAKGTDDIAVTLVGLGMRDAFLRVGDQTIPELATSATWVSRTPFIPPRHVKATGDNSLEGQLRTELRLRGLPDLVVAPTVALPTDADAYGHCARQFRHFVRTRREGRKPAPPPGLCHLTLTLETPVPGPLTLGYGSHFGLGLFVATDD